MAGGGQQEHRFLVKYRLSGEQVYTVVAHHEQNPEAPGCCYGRTELLETFPRHADLTDQNLVLSKHNTAWPPALACIAYVKLVPLTTQQVETIQQDRTQKDTRKIIALNDGEGVFCTVCPSTKKELLEQVEPYRHSDVGKVLWGVNLGELTYYPYYPSRVGRFYATKDGVCPVLRHKYAIQSHKALKEQGIIIPFAAVMEHVHTLGLGFHTYYRMTIIDGVHPYMFFSTEKTFLSDHPDCRIVAKDETPMIKSSYAIPEVRHFMVSLMEEAMQYNIDGVNLCFVRGPEYVGYEQPVVDEFKRLYGGGSAGARR